MNIAAHGSWGLRSATLLVGLAVFAVGGCAGASQKKDVAPDAEPQNPSSVPQESLGDQEPVPQDQAPPAEDQRPPEVSATDRQFFKALIKGDAKTAHALLDEGVDPNVRLPSNMPVEGLSGQSALMVATNFGQAKIVNLLLARGAAVDEVTPSGWSPMLFAVKSGHLGIAKNLLKRQPDLEQGEYEYGLTALIMATVLGHGDMVRLLLDHGANPNTRSKLSWTALSQASLSGDVGIARMLLKHGADSNMRYQPFQFTAIMSAASQGHDQVVRELIRHKADVNAKDKDGDTALIVASAAGHAPTVKLLVGSGAHVRDKNMRGDSALAIAEANGFSDVLSALKRRRAPAVIAKRTDRDHQPSADSKPPSRAPASQ